MLGVRVEEEGRAGARNSALLVIKLQVYPIMDFIAPQRNMVLKNNIPILQDDLVAVNINSSCDQLLKISDGVIGVALQVLLAEWLQDLRW